MTFHPEVDAFLATIRAINPPPIHTLPVAEARASFLRSAQFFGGPVVEVAAVEDSEAEGAASMLPIRIYRPHGLPEGPAPALIFFHGGGWTIGSIETHDKLCRHIAAQSLCAVVSVEYRLAPEHPLPAASLDGIAAVLSLHAGAQQFGLDPGRLAVGGDSAGGTLATAAAIAGRDHGLALRAQVLIYPSLDSRASARDTYPSRIRNEDAPILDRDTMSWFRGHSLPDPVPADDWRVSPMLTPELAGVAPALLLTAECDILHDEAVCYAARLDAAGIEVLQRSFPGQIHGFITLGGVLSHAGEAIETIALFLKQRLRPPGIL